MLQKHNSAVGIFGTHVGAESALKELQKAGFDLKKLSVVAKDYQTEENVIGYYNTGDRVATWGKFGLFGAGYGGYCSALHFLSYRD